LVGIVTYPLQSEHKESSVGAPIFEVHSTHLCRSPRRFEAQLSVLLLAVQYYHHHLSRLLQTTVRIVYTVHIQCVQ